MRLLDRVGASWRHDGPGRLAAWLERLVQREEPPAWWSNDIESWHAEHRTAGSGVWAVRPPCGYGAWTLYRPGSQPDQDGFAQEGDVVAFHPATTEFGGDTDRTVLADVRWWMEPWIAQLAGAPVVDMVEGWSDPYGGEWREYVIYARTGWGRS